MKEIIEASDQEKIAIIKTDLEKILVPENMWAFLSKANIIEMGNKLCKDVFELDNFIFLIQDEEITCFFALEFLTRNPDLLARVMAEIKKEKT